MKIKKTYLSEAAILSLAFFCVSASVAVHAAPASAGGTEQKSTEQKGTEQKSTEQKNIFARVGDTVITRQEYAEAYNGAARGKFYHGKPPEGGVALLQREVGQQLVARVLQLREAKRRGLRPDAAEIEKTVKSYEDRYATSEQWKKNRAQMLPPLVKRMEQDSLLSQLEKVVRNEARADAKDAKAYYLKHPEKFTEPETLRVSVILLKVDPSSPTAGWIKADEEAKGLVKRLRGGADFAALARQLSADPSKEQGGDMGYLHAGMVPEGAEVVLKKMKPGEISDTVRLLQGIAVMRLTDRKGAKLQPFEAVKVRAQELTQRERSEAAWLGFNEDLKKKTPSQMDQSQFLPLVEPAKARGTLK